MKKNLLTVIIILLVLSSSLLRAQGFTYVYYVPLPEQQIDNAFKILYTGTGNVYHTVISVVPSESGLIIFYDNWEDGYEPTFGVKTQASTKIFGNNNAGDGIPPGYGSDLLVAGKPLVLDNDLSLPRAPGTILYDGRDKFGSSQSLACSRSAWANNPGTVLADATEFYNTKTFGTFFYFPIGQNTPSDNSFSLVSLCVMASQNATTVNVDKDGNGSIDVTSVINMGESFQVNGGILSNGTVTSDKPVQTNLITGRIGGTYSSRWYTLLPFYMWDKAYYTPVGTTNTNSRSEVFIYNPSQTTALSLNWQTNAGSGTISIPAKGTNRFAMPLNSAGHFHAATPFYAVGATDMDAAGNLTWDWGYTLIPELFLTNSIYVGWGPGSYGLTSNGNPVWIGSTEDTENTTIYVDLDGDPTTGPLTDINGSKYDYTLIIAPMTFKTIYDASDKDQTGMHVYTLDGKNIVGAWGEDAATAGPGNPFLDVGTALPPDPSFVMRKSYKWVNDVNGNKLADAGDVLRFVIKIANYTLQPYTDIFVYDTLPSKVTYVPNSTYYDLIPLPDQASPNSAFPLDEAGYYISLLPAGAKDSIYFNVTINSPVDYLSFNNLAHAYDNFGSSYHSRVKVPANFAASSCTLEFKTSNYTTDASTYNENATIYLKLVDTDHNLNILALDSVKVTLTSTSPDSELIYLVETGINTGEFRRSIPSSKTTGIGNNNGTLYVSGGQSIAVNYVDEIFGGAACPDNATIIGLSFKKQLYLSDSISATGMDRIKPFDAIVINSATIGGSITSTVTAASTTSSSSSNTTSLSFSHTPGGGTNKLLVVAIAIGYTTNNGNAPALTDVTFNGVSMTPPAGTNNNTGARSYIYYMVNPPAGPANVVITSATGMSIAAGATTFTGVNQSTPVGTAVSTNASSGNPSITVTGVLSGELVFSTAAIDEGGSLQTITTPGTQSQLWNYSSFNFVAGAASTKSGTGSVVSTYTPGDNSQEYAAVAMAIKPHVVINPSAISFTQTPSMCSNLTLPLGGEVKVKLWLTNHAGMGGTGTKTDMSAIVKNNGATFLTLTSPVFTDNGGATDDTLVFTGVVSGSAQTILAGNPVGLEITSTLAGASFQISYDATTVPSLLRLPASNVIDITSHKIYNAPYSGGSEITTAYNGSTVYVRTVVTDPFGYYDINGVSLRITDPGANNTDVEMIQVNSTGCTRTYEYAWTTGVTVGTYNLRAITSEGYENTIKDTAQTTFTLNFLDTGTPCALDFTNSSYVRTGSYPNAGGTIYYSLTDLDENELPSAAESVTMVLISSSGDQETVTLIETGINSGIFHGSISYVISGTNTLNNGTLTATAGATLSLSYTDPDTPTDVCNDNAFIVNGTNSISVLKERIQPADYYAIVGDTIRWRISYTNTGSNPTTGLSLTDTVNATCFTFVTSTPYKPFTNVLTSPTRTLTWNTDSLGGNLAAGESRTIITTYVAAQGCGPRVNRATLSKTNGGASSVTDTSRVALDNPKLTILKTRTNPINTNIYVGDTVTFSIVVTNTGSTTATTVPLVDQYSDYNLLFVSAVPAATSSGAGQILWSNIGPLAPAGVASITLKFKTLHGNQGAKVINNASVDFGVDEHGNPIPSVNDSASFLVLSPPVAVDDYDTTLVNTALTGIVMYNDYDDDGDVLTVIPNSGTAAGIGGTFTIDAAGVYTYTPPPNTTGQASFTYTVCDPTAKCDTATVFITILPCVDPPVRPTNIH